jgi:Fe-S-cluster formation regulator IscX/YfhJ
VAKKKVKTEEILETVETVTEVAEVAEETVQETQPAMVKDVLILIHDAMMELTEFKRQHEKMNKIKEAIETL